MSLGPFKAASWKSEAEHATDECLPRDGSNNAVDYDGGHIVGKSLLETADGGIGLGAEDAIHFKAKAWVTRKVSELKLRLHSADRFSLAALFDGDD